MPRKCTENVAKIHKALIALAGTAKKFEATHGELPGVWSRGMAEIIEDTPELIDIGGNINPGGDKNSMDLTCANSEEEPTLYTTYSINLNSHLIEVYQFGLRR